MLLAAVFVVDAACASIKGSGGGGPGPDGSPDAAGTGDLSPGGDIVVQERPVHETLYVPGCGSAILDPGEKCDDGNQRDGDGCSADCHTIEKDFACPDVGKSCVYTVRCGDGSMGGTE